MKNGFEFKTLAQFMAYFKDEATCVEHFTAARFRNGEYCPHCKHGEIYKFSNGKRYRCASCKQDFTIRTKSIFGESKLPIQKWYIAIYLLSTSGKGISSVQLAKQVGITQKTAWFIDHRVRAAMKQNKGQLFGTMEADETYMGGLSKNMHAKKRREKITGTGGTNKTPVFGIKERGGEVRARVIETADSATLHPILKENIAEGSTLYTDEQRAYSGLKDSFERGVVRHGLKEFAKGDCHTNGIESFWAILKRGYKGIYHHMSRKHLQRYVNEYAFRFNRRALKMQQIFSDVVEGITENSPLRYKTLIQKPV